MRQRVVIAIALALRPKLIIMDEPTTALDVVVEREIMDELFSLKKEYGFAILFISHDLSLMGEIADRIGVMYAGRLVEVGASEDVLDNPVHPYTKGLVGSFPTIHGPKVRLEGIPGNPPNLLELGAGCPFVDRCNRAIDTCQRFVPPLLSHDTKRVACHAANTAEAVA
jgi:peptide/nickel transport system ATP-binding protein